MSTDGWIFDAEHSQLDPYLSEERPHVGYITERPTWAPQALTS
jgi:hypothetical protein